MKMSYFLMAVTTYASLIYYLVNMRKVIMFDTSFLVSRKAITFKKIKMMLRISAIMALINTLTFLAAINISGIENNGNLYNIAFGFICFMAFYIFVMSVQDLVTMSCDFNQTVKALFVMVMYIGVMPMFLVLIFKSQIWKEYHIAGFILVVLSVVALFFSKYVYGKKDITETI